MYPIELDGKNGVILGVANDRSIAWAIARVLGQAGARLALTYQDDRLKERVSRLADTLDGALVVPCDATDDDQIAAPFRKIAQTDGAGSQVTRCRTGGYFVTSIDVRDAGGRSNKADR